MAPVAPPCAKIIPVKTAMKRLNAIIFRNELIVSSSRTITCGPLALSIRSMGGTNHMLR
jgi:hypothetical protein